MASFTKFNAFVNELTKGTHNFSSHTLKIMLTDTAPVATNAVKADITEISAGNGYSSGGSTATLVSNSQSSGTEKLVLSSVTYTATGQIGPFRYAVLYNSTAASGNLIGSWDYGSEVTLQNGDTFTVSLDATNGVLTIQ